MPSSSRTTRRDRVAEITGIPEADIRTAARMIAEAGDWMSCWTMGLNQSTHGTWNTNAICNLHLATGAICRPGSGPLSLTGQPNAMGGREMGYMGPGLPGQRSVPFGRRPRLRRGPVGVAAGDHSLDVGPGTIDMFPQMADGEIKACWIICTNPVATVANRKTVIAGLEAAELVITQDAYREHRDQPLRRFVLPAALWAESDAGDGQFRAQPDAVPAVDPGRRSGAARLADHLPGRRADGLRGALRLQSSEEVFEEIRGSGTRRPATTCAAPATSGCGGPRCSGRARPDDDDRHPIRYLNDGVSQELLVDEDGHAPRLAFPTPSRRAVFFARPHLAAREMPDDDFPLVLNTGRLQHQWHTMTKTGKVAKLNKLNSGPFVEIHPDDAAALDIADGDPSRWPRAAAGRCCPPWSPTGCGRATASRRSTGTTNSASTSRSTR